MKWKLTKNAMDVLEAGGADGVEDESLQKFVENISCSDGFWYGVSDGGYIDLAEIIADQEQLTKANEAVELLRELQQIYGEISYEY